MDCFRELPLKKRKYMELLFQNCTEEVRYYMTLIDVEEGCTFIKAGTECTHIYIILSGKVTGVEWPMHERAYSFKDFGPGDFFGEIECFAGLLQYRISLVASTPCRILSIPAAFYMQWMQMDVDALFMRTQENMARLIAQTAEARKYLFMEGKERLMAHLIQKYEQKYPLVQELELLQTRSQLSEEVGLSMKTLDRSIKKLEEMGIIRIRKGKIVISREGYQSMKDYIEHYING